MKWLATIRLEKNGDSSERGVVIPPLVQGGKEEKRRREARKDSDLDEVRGERIYGTSVIDRSRNESLLYDS